MLPILISAVIVYIFQEVRYNVWKPVALEQKSADNAEAWKDFIIANINSCKTSDQCKITYELIKLFVLRYEGEKPDNVFHAWVENVSTRLDKRYRILKQEEIEIIKQQEAENELTIDPFGICGA